jgi:hypothetical protein
MIDIQGYIDTNPLILGGTIGLVTLIIQYIIKNYSKEKKIDSNHLIDFLKLCAIEQRGKHTLSFGVDNLVKADQSVVEFILKLKEILLNLDNNDEQINFLNKFNSINLDNLFWSQERDCQIFETGNHIVNLCFKLHINDKNYLINFMAIFEQQFNQFPKDLKNINIILINDQIYFDHNQNVNIMSQNQKISRKKIKSSSYSCDSDTIRQINNHLPSLFKSSSEYKIKPKLQPDACLIS